MQDIINLISDTSTNPTEEMRKAMYEAEVGDDVFKFDPTVNKLQKMAAEMVGTEDSLFVPTGTMGNLLGMMGHCPAGKEIFIETKSHIITSEGGGITRIAGLMPNMITGKNGIIDPDDLRAAIRNEDVHFPTPGMICIENTHNSGGGTVYPMEYLKEFRNIADKHNLKFHLDGARVFNAAVYLGVDVKEIVKYADSVSFCLSKGLSAPMGSMLCGTKAFIKEAERIRKMLGGGLRQIGLLAAAGIVSLTQMTDRLADDHRIAKDLANGMNSIDGITVDVKSVQTNILFLNFNPASNKNATNFGKELKETYGVLCGVRNPGLVRMVVHRHIGEEQVKYVLDCAKKIMA